MGATDNRDPYTCGMSVGFDGIFVCSLCHLPCFRVPNCPEIHHADTLQELLAKEVIGQ